MGVATDERRALCDLFEETGPDGPTLCEGWLTRDLAAHLVIREHRYDAAPGIALKALAGHTRRVQDRYAAQPWPELVEQVRRGPAVYWPTRIAALDELVNSVEFFVHHEDVRRARAGWEPRPADESRDAVLWRGLARIGRLTFRRSPVGVLLRRAGGSGEAEVLAKRGPSPVVISGEPGELLMFAFGRDQAKIDFSGEQSSVDAVRGLRRGL